MNSSDINTQDYINPSVDSERMRRSRPASTRTSDEKQSRRRPIPDPEARADLSDARNPTQSPSSATTAPTLLSAYFCACSAL